MTAGDQFSFSLIYLTPAPDDHPEGWGSILVFPDILETAGKAAFYLRFSGFHSSKNHQLGGFRLRFFSLHIGKSDHLRPLII